MLIRKIGYGLTIALLATVAPLAAQDAEDDAKSSEEIGLRIEILDMHSGRHFILDPNSDFNVQGSAAFSPDQKWVVFEAIHKGDKSTETQILLTKVDGSQELPTELGHGMMPSFSKDGKRIAYSDPNRKGVWFMGVDGKDKQLIDPHAWSITFSPHDNDVVAYLTWTNEGQNIRVHNLDTGEKRLLLSEEAQEQYRTVMFNFQWSPDGSEIVCCARPRHENSQANSPSDPVIATIGTGEDPKIKVVTAEAVNNRVVFHPITKEVFFTKRTPSKGTHRIFSVNPELPRKFRNPNYLVHQPDGRWNIICDFSSDGNLAAICSKNGSSAMVTDADSFDEHVRTSQVVAAKLKVARNHLKQENYKDFVDELMGNLDEADRDDAIESVEESAYQWLGIINYALNRTDRAKVTDDSVSFGTGKFGRDLTFIKDGGWGLETADLP